MRTHASFGLAVVGLVLAGCDLLAPPDTGLETPPSIPGSVAVTPWEVAEDPPEGFGPGLAGFASPDALMEALLDCALRSSDLPGGSQVTSGISQVAADGASAWILMLLSEDDSIAGHEIELRLFRDARGWHVSGMRFRTHCLRAVDLDSLRCV